MTTMNDTLTINFIDDKGMPRIVTVSNKAEFRVSGNADNYLLSSYLRPHLCKESEPSQEQFFRSSNKDIIIKCMGEISKCIQKSESFCDLVNIQQEKQESESK